MLLNMMLGSAPALAVIAWLLKFWWVLALAGRAAAYVLSSTYNFRLS